MKFAGITLLSLTPLLLGLEYRICLNKRKKFLRLFAEFIMFFKEQIRFSGRERSEIFILALSDPRFNMPIFKCLEKSLKNGENITKILDDYNDIRLKSKDIFEINAFLNGLGTSDIEGQLSHCEYYLSVFNKLGEMAEEGYVKKSKLSLGLCLSLGAFMFIIMI